MHAWPSVQLTLAVEETSQTQHFGSPASLAEDTSGCRCSSLGPFVVVGAVGSLFCFGPLSEAVLSLYHPSLRREVFVS